MQIIPPEAPSDASGPVRTVAGMQIREFQNGQPVEAPLLVREVQCATKRDGAEYLRITFGDRTGTVKGIMWEGHHALAQAVPPGTVAQVTGRFQVSDRYGPQLVVSGLQPALEGSYDPSDLLDGPPRAAAQMEADLRALIETIQRPHLRRLLDALLGADGDGWAAYRDAPAAKYYHQAYRHGLLEHSLSVAQGVSTISATFPGIDRDIAVTGALLHDIGKLQAYTSDPMAIDLTDAGRLQGEIPLGYYAVRRTMEDLDGFPAADAEAVLHIILSHHGSLEHGSPVVPQTREATLVHMIDNLGGRLGSFDRLEKELPDGERWSRFDRALGGSAFFGQPPGGLTEAA